jgi:hypothetical protein
MKVRIVARDGYGDRYGDFHRNGDEVEYMDRLAVKLIGLGVAEAVREPVIETAAVEPPKNAARRTSKPAPRGAPRKRRFSPEKE